MALPVNLVSDTKVMPPPKAPASKRSASRSGPISQGDLTVSVEARLQAIQLEGTSATTTSLPKSASSLAGLTSASELARTSKKFETWAKSIHLNTTVRPNLPENLVELRDLEKKCWKLPSWLFDKHSTQFNYLKSISADVVQKFCSSASDIRDLVEHDTEPCDDLALILGTIVLGNRHADRLDMKPMTYLNPTEHDRRFPVDNIMSIACDYDDHMIYCTERPIKLPRSAAERLVEATSDSLTLIYVKDATRYTTLVTEMREHYSCIAHPSPPDEFLVLHMVNEYKLDTLGQNQVLMGLATALYQRRVLGFEDHFVFGTIHFDKVRLRAVAATWEKGKIEVYKLKEFDMRDPVSMIQYYLLVRAINAIALRYCSAIRGKLLDRVPITVKDPWTPRGVSSPPSARTPTSHEQTEDKPAGGGRSREAGDGGAEEVEGLEGDGVNEDGGAGEESEEEVEVTQEKPRSNSDLGIALRQVGDWDKMIYVRAILSLNEDFPPSAPLEAADFGQGSPGLS